MKKTVLQIHRWLGFASGLVVFILGITGAIWEWEKELSDVFYKDLFTVTDVRQTQLSPDSLLAIAQKTLGPAYPVTRIEITTKPNRAVQFYSYKGDRKAPNYWKRVQYDMAVFINPYTGSVLGVKNFKWEFFNVVVAIHTSLLLGETGSYIIGWSTVLFVIILISGFILWYPKNKAAAKQRFWFRWKKTTTAKRKNYDLHNILGFYSLAVLLIIALTGLVWSFDWWEESVMTIANGGKKVTFQKPVYSDTTQTRKTLQLAGIVQQTYSEFQPFSKCWISLPTKKEQSVAVVIPGEGRKRYQFRQVYFDQYSGKRISRAKLYQEKSTGEKLRNMNLDIHTGSILGLAGKLLACFCSLIVASLPVTGLYIWLGKRRKKKPVTVITRERLVVS